MSKEREAFESWAYSKKWNIARVRDMALDHYVDDFVNGAWHGWQAKAQAVPEGYAVVPVEPKRETIKQMNKVWFESNCAHIMKTKTAELLYKAMLEAQQPSSTSDCPDEP